MNCLNGLLSKDRAVAKVVVGAEVEPCDITEVSVRVPPPLVRVAPASLFSPAGKRFRQGLQQVGGVAIALGG